MWLCSNSMSLTQPGYTLVVLNLVIQSYNSNKQIKKHHKHVSQNMSECALYKLKWTLTVAARAPNDAQFARLLRTRTEIHPLQVCPMRGVDPPTLLLWGVFTLCLKLCTVRRPIKA